MRSIILMAIRVYREVSTVLPRRHCLFAESCSVHVERVVRREGALAGTKAFLRRLRACRPGFRLTCDPLTHRFIVLLRDGSWASIGEMTHGLYSFRPVTGSHHPQDTA